MATDSSVLGEFKLERAVFEIRYPPAYLIWDNHGAIWCAIGSIFPDLEMVDAAPNKSVFRVGRKLELAVEATKATILSREIEDRKLVSFAEQCDLFFRPVAEYLQLNELTRIGTRISYFREYKDEESASCALLASNILSLPEGRHFDEAERAKYPHVAVRYEGDTIGGSIRLRTEGRTTKFDPPAGIKELQPVNVEEVGVLFDVDIYTMVPIAIGQAKPSEYVKRALKLARREAGQLLGR